MAKRVALIGHCGPDSSYLRMAVTTADRGARVITVDDSGQLESLLNEGLDLLLFNRVLDYGFDEYEGAALIRKLRERYPGLKMMLVSNYPDAQAAAIEVGALPGFGKRDIGSPKAKELLRLALADDASVS